MPSGGGKVDIPEPEPVWKQAGYESEGAYRQSIQDANDATKRLADAQEELARFQAESAARTEEMTAQQLAFQRSAFEAQQKAAAQAEARRQAEEAALQERSKRRLALAASRGGSLLTGGQGATGQMQVQRKSLLGQ